MKKIILSIVLCMVLICTLTSCENSSNEKYYGDYHDGYVEGYDEGIIEGKIELGGYADYRFDEICSENDIEEALAILILYEDGESFTEDEISHAIWMVRFFYEDVCNMVSEIENYYDE